MLFRSVKEELENILNMLYDIIQWKIQYPDEGVDIPQLNDLEKIICFSEACKCLNRVRVLEEKAQEAFKIFFKFEGEVDAVLNNFKLPMFQSAFGPVPVEQCIE